MTLRLRPSSHLRSVAAKFAGATRPRCRALTTGPDARLLTKIPSMRAAPSMAMPAHSSSPVSRTTSSQNRRLNRDSGARLPAPLASLRPCYWAATGCDKGSCPPAVARPLRRSGGRVRGMWSPGKLLRAAAPRRFAYRHMPLEGVCAEGRRPYAGYRTSRCSHGVRHCAVDRGRSTPNQRQRADGGPGRNRTCCRGCHRRRRSPRSRSGGSRRCSRRPGGGRSSCR